MKCQNTTFIRAVYSRLGDIGPIEASEIFTAADKKAAHSILTVQCKRGKDKLYNIQIEQDFAVCEAKFPALICRPIAAQFMAGDLIALFAFEQGATGVAITAEKHYRLVPPEDMTAADIDSYRARPM